MKYAKSDHYRYKRGHGCDGVHDPRKQEQQVVCDYGPFDIVTRDVIKQLKQRDDQNQRRKAAKDEQKESRQVREHQSVKQLGPPHREIGPSGRMGQDERWRGREWETGGGPGSCIDHSPLRPVGAPPLLPVAASPLLPVFFATWPGVSKAAQHGERIPARSPLCQDDRHP